MKEQNEEKMPQGEKEKIEDVMKSLMEEQMKLHPEIYDKNGEQ